MLLALTVHLAAQTAPTFRSGVSLVHVDTGVVDQNARVLTGLAKNDFRVFDEGREQSLVGFSAEEQPLDLILLLDASGSMRSDVEKVSSAAHQALLELRNGDRVSVLAFNTKTRVIATFTEDRDAVEAALTRLVNSRFGGGTRIQDAVYEAANRFILFDDRDERRRAVLIVTDNIGRRTRRPMSVIETLWEADAPLNGLVTKNRKSLAGLLAGHAHLPGGIDELVEKTGGEAIRVEDLSSAFPEMMHRIRTRYSLYYRMPDTDDGSIRSIRVELSTDAQRRFPQARVIARQGYRAQNKDQHGFTTR